jgi:hypothetical protein
VVATPELAILRRLVPRHFYGHQLAAIANPLLQRVTAWGAAKMLNAGQILILAAPLIALEVNMLCVASVGPGIDIFGHADRSTLKEWLAWGATGLGVAQVIGLGLALAWLSSRRGTPIRGLGK